MKSLSTGYGGGEASGSAEKGWREGGGGRGREEEQGRKTVWEQWGWEGEKENMGKRRMRGEGRGGEMGIGRIWDSRKKNNKLQIGLIFPQRVSNEVHVPPSLAGQKINMTRHAIGSPSSLGLRVSRKV